MTFEKYKSFKWVNKIDDHYKMGRELGKGSFGSVFATENIQTKIPAAIKIIKKDKLTENEVYMDLMRNELTVLEKCDHPHITRVFELMEDQKHFYVVMEFLSGGDLMGQVQKLHQFSEEQAAQCIYQIMLALNYMHQRNVTHRDLKPENLMTSTTEKGNLFIKLTDFGFATFFDPSRKMDVIVGTPIYMAPELANGDEYDCRVDIWSVGVITYILLGGRPPFDGKDTDEIKDQILNKELKFDEECWDPVSNQAIDFIQACLKRDVIDRPFVDQLLSHGWIRKWNKEPEIDQEIIQLISDNICSFPNLTPLQRGVLSVNANLLTTSSDLEEYIRAFEKLDTTHDGCISIEEMKKGLKLIPAMRAVGSEEHWDKITSAMDSTGEGKINFNEFLAAAFDRKKLLSPANIQVAFNLFDRDHDGFFELKELKSLFGFRAKVQDQRLEGEWKELLANCDLDGDGKISLKEFQISMESAILVKSD